MSNKVMRIVFFAAIIAAIGFGVMYVQRPVTKTLESESQIDSSENIIVTPLELGGEFELVDTNGNQVTQASYEGKVKLLFFGFTFCPDFCPTELTTLSHTMEILDQKGFAGQVQAIFATIDPERDTTETLRNFLKPYHPSIVGLRGTNEQVDSMKALFKVYASKVPTDAGGYVMDHSTFLYVLNKEGTVVSMIRFGAEAEEIAAHVIETLTKETN